VRVVGLYCGFKCDSFELPSAILSLTFTTPSGGPMYEMKCQLLLLYHYMISVSSVS